VRLAAQELLNDTNGGPAEGQRRARAQPSAASFPEGVGRYRWTVKGNTLRFEQIGKEPCGGRADILDGAVYKRIS
jgi:hypothetical protein